MPWPPTMLQDLGKIYFHDGQYEKAMEALSAGSSEKSPEGKLYLGRTQMELGRMAEARDTFENLVRDNEELFPGLLLFGGNQRPTGRHVRRPL
jgi:tetratricopeptide (TPR) repeat protein